MEKAAGLLLFRKYRDTIQFLLLKASYGIHHWSPPKGHWEQGEALMETAIRETEEECGIKREDINILDFSHTCCYDVKGRPKTVYFRLAELLNVEKQIILSDEHIEYKWLAYKETLKLVDFKPTHELFLAANDYLHSQTI